MTASETTQVSAADWFDEAKLRAFLAKAPELVPPIRPLDDLMLAWPQLRELMDQELVVFPKNCYLRRDAREHERVAHLYDFDELTHEHRKMTLLAAWFWGALQAVPSKEDASVDLVVRRVKELAFKRSDVTASLTATQSMRALADFWLRERYLPKLHHAISMRMLGYAWREKQAYADRLEQYKHWKD